MTSRCTGSPTRAPLRNASTGKITTTTSALPRRRPIRSKCRWPSRCSRMRSIARRKAGRGRPIRRCTTSMKSPRAVTSPLGNSRNFSPRRSELRSDQCAKVREENSDREQEKWNLKRRKLQWQIKRRPSARASLVFATLPWARNIAARPVGMLGAKRSRSPANVATRAAL